ncbi:MAG: GNAT family N-acetyltransferase [Firmicutes bacterium]|nr:GNAT family N-acetyltransferase [Bacillota bacterium]
MEGLIIRRPKELEEEYINELFELVIKDTFKKNNIEHLTSEIDEEIIDKRRMLREDFSSCGEDRFFLVAEYNEMIIGTIAIGISNYLISEITNGKFDKVVELGTLYVHPDFHGMGIASLMIDEMIIEMKNRAIKEFCLDSGYKTAQKIWMFKFGKPEYHMVDYWDKGSDHMIWKVRIN